MRLDAGNENVTDDAFYRKADLHIAGHAKAIYNLANISDQDTLQKIRSHRAHEGREQRWVGCLIMPDSIIRLAETVAAKLFTLQDEKPTGAFLGGPTWASVSDRCKGLEVGTGVLTIGTACYSVIQENISIFVKGAFP